MPRTAVLLASALAMSLSVAVLSISVPACDDGAVPQRCSNIPVGGCPLSHGVACGDPACDAIYACRANNVWELQQKCPPHDEAGARPIELLDASFLDAAPRDASFDAPPGAFGGPGCSSLEVPDCSLGLAQSCGPGCCDCEDVFVCQNGAWELWGACIGGALVSGSL